MKAITLWQPWATLVALGGKRVETRSWETPYRGLLAIHAAKSEPVLGCGPEVNTFLAKHGLEREYGEGKLMPLGSIVATCRLVACEKITERLVRSARAKRGDDEIAFGDWTPGRFAWGLADVVAVDPPIPTRGRQKLWDWWPTPEEAIRINLARPKAAT